MTNPAPVHCSCPRQYSFYILSNGLLLKLKVFMLQGRVVTARRTRTEWRWRGRARED